MLYCSTPRAIVWTVAATCPRCAEPLVLRHTRTYHPFVSCAAYPTCRFTSAYDRMVHALLDRIIELQDTLEDLGHPVERSVP